MYNKDYILRMIEMLGDLLRGILGLIRKGDLDGASSGLEKIYNDMLKQDSSFFRDLRTEDLTDVLLQDHNYTGGHLEILAELFNSEAILSLAKDNKQESLEYSKKSLSLFTYVDNEQKTYIPDRIRKMDDIRARIRSLS